MNNTENQKLVFYMIKLYCKKNCGSKKQLCEQCNELQEYVKLRLSKCPHINDKPFCSNCRTHCYKPVMRDKIKAVMRFSGPRMIFHHPIMAIKHLISTKKHKAELKKELAQKNSMESQTKHANDK